MTVALPLERATSQIPVRKPVRTQKQTPSVSAPHRENLARPTATGPGPLTYLIVPKVPKRHTTTHRPDRGITGTGTGTTNRPVVPPGTGSGPGSGPCPGPCTGTGEPGPGGGWDRYTVPTYGSAACAAAGGSVRTPLRVSTLEPQHSTATPSESVTSRARPWRAPSGLEVQMAGWCLEDGAAHASFELAVRHPREQAIVANADLQDVHVVLEAAIAHAAHNEHLVVIDRHHRVADATVGNAPRQRRPDP